MPVRIKDLKKETRKIEVDFHGEKLNVEYRVNLITPAFIQETEKWTRAEDTQRLLGAAVVSWDLLGEDDQPMGLSLEVLNTLPVEFLQAVLKGITDDMRGPEEKKA